MSANPRVVKLLTLLCIAAGGAFLGGYATAMLVRESRGDFHTRYYENISLPGGGRGDLFLFHSENLRHTVKLALFVKADLPRDLAVFPAGQDTWVMLIIPDTPGNMRVLTFPGQTNYVLLPPNPNILNDETTANAQARPGRGMRHGNLCIEKSYNYTNPGRPEQLHASYALHLLEEDQ